MKIRRILERMHVERDFTKSLSPEALSSLENAGEFPKVGITTRHFQFIIVHLDESNPEEVPGLIERVVGILIQGAMLSSITSSVIIGLLGVPSAKNDSIEARMNLVKAILAENGNRVRIAHGQCNGLVGLLGPKGGWRYDAIIPDFSRIMKKLFAIEFGASVEIS